VKAMNTWDAEPLWRLFERWGVDARTMTPYPIAGPPRSESPPEPAPTGRATAGEVDAAELSRKVWKAEATLRKVQAEVERWRGRPYHVRHHR
jgi:hypothetical protein